MTSIDGLVVAQRWDRFPTRFPFRKKIPGRAVEIEEVETAVHDDTKHVTEQGNIAKSRVLSRNCCLGLLGARPEARDRMLDSSSVLRLLVAVRHVG